MKKFLYILCCLFVFIAGVVTGGNVNINVGGKTSITGATIAAVDETGADNGNLNISTNELEYHDIQNVDSNSASGFGINTSIGGSKTDKGEQNKHPSGTTAVSITNTGHETAGITHATIGNGTITVGGDTNPDLANLNRDITKSDEITRDQTTHALDATVSVDNRVFTSDGRADIANQHEHLVDNTAKAVFGATGTVANTVRTVVDTATTGEVSDSIDNWKSGQQNIVNIANVSADGREVLNNLSDGQSIENIEAATNDNVTIYYDERDASGGFYDVNARDNADVDGVYINAANGAVVDTDAFMNTWGHETSHEFTDNERVATSAGSFTNDMWKWSNALNFTSTNDSGTMTSGQWALNQMQSPTSGLHLIENTYQAANVAENDKRNVVVFGGSWVNVLASSKPTVVRPIVETAAKAGTETIGKTVGNVGKSATDTLFKNGKPIGSRGTRQNIRTLPKNEFQQKKIDLLKDAKETPSPSTYPGKTYRAPDGTEFGIRNSAKHGETIDIMKSPTGAKFKIHLE